MLASVYCESRKRPVLTLKLPKQTELVHPDHHFLFKHDLEEFYANKPIDFNTRFYKNRFATILSEVSRLQKKLQRNPSQIKILDIGCAQGNFSITLAEMGFSVVALDLRFHFLSYSRMKHEKGDLRWVNASLENLPFLSGTFDIVLATEVIEHVAYPERLLDGLKDQGSDRPRSPRLLLARAVKRARGSLLWERLWPALASLSVAVGLFLALSWAGLWIVLPPLARAFALVSLLLVMALAAIPLLRLRVPKVVSSP